MDRETVAIYEARSAAYEAARAPRHADAARALAARAPEGVVADLGSGPGWYTAAMRSPALALDGALAMLRRMREVAPGVLLVRGDLSALPFRRAALAGGFARNTYVHLPTAEVPLALADLHRSLSPGAPVELTFFRGDVEGRGIFPGDDFPGRFFSSWPPERLRDVVVGAGFELDALEEGEEGLTVRATRARTLPDTVGPGLHLLVCGLNPSVHAADAGVGFVTGSNRFWRAAVAAGLVTQERDAWHAIRHHGIGMTDLVKRATPRADELTRAEYRDGAARLDRLCAWLEPAAVCLVGLAGWRAAVAPKAQPGWQDATLGGRPVYVMPSTSGLNATTSLDALVDHLRAARFGT